MRGFNLALTAAVLAMPAASVAATRVSSNSNCPSSDAISVKLLALLAAGGPETASARVRSDGKSMQIEVSTPGEEGRQRTVPATGDCDAQAEMAALIIAAWLDAMPVGTLSAPGIPPREVRAAPGSSSGESDPLDEPEGDPVTISTRTILGAGILGFADGQGAVGGLAATVAMPNLLENFGWSLEASLGLPRQISVGQGIAHIWRPTFALSASAELYRKHWVVRAQTGAALGILLVNGTDYSANRSSTSVTWGASAGLCLLRPWKRHEMWLRLDGVAWPQGRAVRSNSLVSSQDISVPLPEWEIRSSVGFSWWIL
jgi:hypothetical protein